VIQALLATSAVGAVGGGGAVVSLGTVAALTVAGASGTFASCTATTTGATASAWVWSVISQSGGTFSIASGAGTATAAAQVTGAVGATATALLQCVVTTSAGTFTVTTPLTFTNSTVVSVSIETVPAKTGVSGSAVFNACAVTVTGGTASSYVWSFPSQSGGTFTENGGQSTFVFGSQVSGVAAGTTATATLQCVVTVAGIPYTVSTPLSYQNTSGGALVTVDISPLSGSATGSTAVVTSSARVAAVNGGTGPYTQVWACTANDGGFPNTNFTAVSATALTSTLRATGLDVSDGVIVATFTCTVTDSLGAFGVGSCTVSFSTTFNP